MKSQTMKEKQIDKKTENNMQDRTLKQTLFEYFIMLQNELSINLQQKISKFLLKYELIPEHFFHLKQTVSGET